MAQLMNQFSQAPVKGALDLPGIGDVVSGMVYSSEAVALVPGQGVKIVDSAGGVPKFTATTVDGDIPFGFVIGNLKDISYAASDRVEIALPGAFMWMEAGAAIARGAAVEAVVATQKVITSAGANPVIGQAFDKAAADGDLIRVWIKDSALLLDGLQVVTVTATLAELNAGKILIPATPGYKIQVSDYIARVTGAFTTLTSADLQSSTTGTKVTALAQAGLTNGAILRPTSSNTTLGAGFGAPLESGEGLKLVNVGTAAAGGTSIAFTITYKLVKA